MNDLELVGCVLLEVDDSGRTAELTYALRPDHSGGGLATRMIWTAIQCAFPAGCIERIVAGADEPDVVPLHS